MNLLGFLIAIAPLLALICLLVARRYPGEAVIERLRVMIEAAVAVAAPVQPDPGRFADFEVTVRGGRLLACSLAGRAPPVRS